MAEKNSRSNHKWIAGLLCVFCLMIAVPCSANAASYKKIYKAFLSQDQIQAGNLTIRPKWYYVLNINKKGVPELIVASRRSQITYYYVYTISGSRIKYLGSFQSQGNSSARPVISYSSKWKGLIAEGWNDSINGVWSHMYILQKKKLSAKYRTLSYFNSSGKQVYRIGKSRKRVSWKKYHAFRDKYYRSADVFKMLKTDAENLKESFG